MYDDQYDIWDLSDDYNPNALPQEQAQPTQPAPITWGSMNPPQNVPGGWQDEHTGGFVPANGGNPSGYMDLSYWTSRGTPPDQMFDFATGQLRPGWQHTARGYEQSAPAAVTPSTGGDYTPPGGYGGGGGGWGYLTEPFAGRPPSWQSGPSFSAPRFSAPPPFSYKEFQAPTEESVYADPSYKFRKGEGEQALSNRIASTGAYRTGGTLKDFVNYNQNAASQEYSNIFKRAADTHNMGLEQALGTYGTNYGVSRDVYDRLFNASRAEFEPQQRENEMMNQREFDNFLASYDIFDRDRRRAGDYLFQGAELGNG